MFHAVLHDTRLEAPHTVPQEHQPVGSVLQGLLRLQPLCIHRVLHVLDLLLHRQVQLQTAQENDQVCQTRITGKSKC